MFEKFYFDLLSLKTEMQFRGYSISTQKTYYKTVKEFLEITGKEVINIKRDDIIRYLDNNLKILDVNTVLVKLNALEFFFTEILGIDIAENIRKYKRKFKTKEFLSMEQLNILVSSVPTRERLIYKIVIETGMIVDEVMDLTVKDLNLKNNTWELKGCEITKELATEITDYTEKNYLEHYIFTLLKRAIDYCIVELNQDKDELIAEFTNGAMGNNYPVPSRILLNTEQICLNYLIKNLFSDSIALKNTKLFATEGATAAMCYIFKSLRINGILKKGDKIAINTPIFSPYFQIPELSDYEMIEIDLESKEENDWKLIPNQLELLKNPEIKMLFIVNPSNPGARALQKDDLVSLKQIIDEFRKDLIVLSDDVYATFVDDFKSIYSVIPANTILVYSYSKIFGTTGVRLGVIGLNENNVLDKYLKNLSEMEKNILRKRYSLVSLNPDELSFIDRLDADSRDVALAHTSGLSTPQQIMMALFSLVSLCDKDNSYIEECKKMVRERYSNLYKGLGFLGDNTPGNSKYYTLIDIYKIAENLYGQEFSQKLRASVDSMDFLYYLASQKGVVLIDAVGFKAPAGTLRVSQANLPLDAYVEIGKYILEMIDHYKVILDC